MASLYSRLAVPFHLNILKDEKVVENFYRFNKRMIPRGAKCESLGRDLALERKKNAGKKEPCRFFRFQTDGWALRGLIDRQVKVESNSTSTNPYHVGITAVPGFYNLRGAQRYISVWCREKGEKPPYTRRGRELSKLELVDPQGEMNEITNAKSMSPYEMRDEIKDIKQHWEKDKKDKIQSKPPSIWLNNE